MLTVRVAHRPRRRLELAADLRSSELVGARPRRAATLPICAAEKKALDRLVAAAGFTAHPKRRSARWRSARPLWTDASFGSVAPALTSSCVLAAVRSATVGMPIDESAPAPFRHGRWLLSHNGRIDRRALAARPTAESMCDSALLAAEVFGAGADSLADTVRSVARRDPSARLNLLLTDGTRVLATTWGDTLTTWSPPTASPSPASPTTTTRTGSTSPTATVST